MVMITDSLTTRTWFLPGIVTAAAAAHLTALTAGEDITCMMTKSSTLPAYGDDKTTTEDLMCSSEEIKAIIGSTIVDATLILVHDFTGTLLSTTDPTTIFTGNENQGTIVVRSGPRFDAVAATGQLVDCYPVSCGKFQKMRGSGEGFLKGKVKLYSLGGSVENLALTA